MPYVGEYFQMSFNSLDLLNLWPLTIRNGVPNTWGFFYKNQVIIYNIESNKITILQQNRELLTLKRYNRKKYTTICDFQNIPEDVSENGTQDLKLNKFEHITFVTLPHRSAMCLSYYKLGILDKLFGFVYF